MSWIAMPVTPSTHIVAEMDLGTATIAVWRLKAHHLEPDDVVLWTKTNGRIAIGWSDVGHLGSYLSKEDIGKAIRRAYPTLRNSTSRGPSLYHFYHTLKTDDLVIVKGRTDACVMRVLGDYELVPFDPRAQVSDYQHQREAIDINVDPERLGQLAGAHPTPGHNSRWPLFRYLKTISVAQLRKLTDGKV